MTPPANFMPRASAEARRGSSAATFAAIASCGSTSTRTARLRRRCGKRWRHCRRRSTGAFFLGLDSFEGHYALYPPGACYRRHRDRFRDDDARVISCALYLNDDWSVADGGALRMHLPDGPHDIVPAGGAFVCFIAEHFEHEVLPSARERLAVSGWFRRRRSSGRCA